MNNTRPWLVTGCVMAALAVVFGAFGAHGLEKPLQELYADSPDKLVAGFKMPASFKYLQDFKTAAQYQMYHALGLIALGLVAQGQPKKSDRVAGWSFVFGTLLFSGSLYVLVLTGMKWLGAITPIGGTLLIVAWIALAMSCKRVES